MHSNRSSPPIARPWIAAIPAVVVLTSFAAVLVRAAWLRESTELSYRMMARQAMVDGDHDKARIYYSRLVTSDRPVDPLDEFNWAQVLAMGGDTRTATELLHRLAPDDGSGLPEAHRVRAVQLARLLSSDEEPHQAVQRESVLEQMRHHLIRSGQQNPLELCDLWAAYYWAAGKPIDALDKVAEAAQWDPERWLQVVTLSGQIADLSLRKRYLSGAEKHYRATLKDKPLDYHARIALARILIATDQADDAAMLLQDGLALSDRAELRRAASDVAIYQMHDIRSPLREDFAQSIALLAKAMQLDPTNPAVYARLLEVYQRAQSDDQRMELRSALEAQIASGDAIALAHFALGGILWLQGDTKNSLWHTEKAFAINPDLLDVANNLAWLLSEEEQADLQRAYDLIDSVVQRQPGNPHYRDTKGTILMKMQRWEEALTEFEIALPHTRGESRKKTHQHLAAIYQHLDKPNLAEMHRAAAKKFDR